MSPDGRRVTMPDVARAAGVSTMTVSYAFSRPDRVAAATRQRVLDAAAELGYAGPHAGARSLRQGRTGTLGVVLGEHLTYAFDDPQATQFLAGVSGVCVEHQLGLTLIPVTGGPDDGDRVREAAVDGLVLWTTVDDDPVLDVVRALGLPTVVHGAPQVEGLSLVAVDDRAAARAVGAAAFAGARSPAVLSFPLDRARRSQTLLSPDPASVPFGVTRHRLQGYADAATDAGLDWSHVPVVVLAHNNPAEASIASARLLREHPEIDALAAMSDVLALAVLETTGAQRLSVTGWDDGPLAEAAGLTTVAQSLREQGELCARAVVDPAADVTAPSWRLVERATTRRSKHHV